MVQWIKQNKGPTIVILLLLVLLCVSYLKGFYGRLGSSFPISMPSVQDSVMGIPSGSRGVMMEKSILPQEFAPQPGVANRLVIEESSLSLLVRNVTETRDAVVNNAEQNGGYMVTSSVTNPTDAPTSTVTVRIPSTKLKETLNYLRSISVKVVSENLIGQDVTDQFVDVEKRIAILETTKGRFESILGQATEVSDITNLSQQIIYTQEQIDSLRGQQEALTKNAQLAKLTVYLSTDEIALPYAPSETFRPEVIFKLAVRSLVGTLRQAATFGIWLLVYGVVWIPVAVLVFLVWRKVSAKKV